MSEVKYIMRSLDERESALNMRFKEGQSYKYIAEKLSVPQDTVKSWCRRYKQKMGSLFCDKIGLGEENVRREDIHNREAKTDTPDDRIARLEMEVDLLRNFLILAERG